MQILRANYDLVATASTAGILLAVGAPWPLWAAWGVLLSYQLGNRVVNGWAR